MMGVVTKHPVRAPSWRRLVQQVKNIEKCDGKEEMHRIKNQTLNILGCPAVEGAQDESMPFLAPNISSL